ncbi:hypothetical protein NSND_60919 [Nitrospira sp. ND1]|nr:hypothetical protein NSND_60919 [Nitrospira sp. ND1]
MRKVSRNIMRRVAGIEKGILDWQRLTVTAARK